MVLPVEGKPNLSLLPSGPGSHRAADLIGPRLSSLLDEFAKEYDLVILDAPPLLGFAECLQMATAADGVLIISRAGETRRKAVAAVISVLHRLHANIIGVVMNQVSHNTSSDGYSYYGYYHRPLRLREDREIRGLIRTVATSCETTTLGVVDRSPVDDAPGSALIPTRGPETTRDLANLDLLRSVAVGLVFVGHMMGMMRIRGLGDVGHFGVLLFFVHTSLVLMLSMGRLGLSGGRLYTAFMVRRIFRIYPLSVLTVLLVVAFVFLPPLGLGDLCGLAGLDSFQTSC